MPLTYQNPLCTRAWLALAIASLGLACGSTSTKEAPAASTIVASFRLVPATTASGPVTEVTPPRDAAQVALLLSGDPVPVDDLIAEIGRVGAPDEARRWSVEAPRQGDAGVAGRIVVPIYAVPPGDHVLTLWRGDAEVLAHFRFRVP